MNEILNTAAIALEPPPDIDYGEWCEQNIVIPGETGTPWAGPYRRSNTPWVEGWFKVMQDPKTRLFACKKGGQIAWTQTCMCALLCRQVTNPGSGLFVMDSLDNARDTSRLRLQPIISASKAVRDALRGGFDDDKQSADGMMNVLYRFNRSYLRFIGAQSPGKAASFTYRDLDLEEPEKYKDVVGNEGNVIESLLERVKRIWNSLVLIGCTPTTKKGFIQKYVDYGDDMMYFVKCPKCGAAQILVFHHKYFDLGHEHVSPATLKAMVFFDPELSPIEAGRSAYIECGNDGCKHHITKAEKEQMIEPANGAEWCPTRKPSMEGYRSCELSGLYPRGDAASAQGMVQKFLAAKENRTDLQIVINSGLGELWDDSRDVTGSERRALWQFRDMHRYERGIIPATGWLKTVLLVDVQQASIPWAIWALQPHDAYMVNCGRVIAFDEIEAMIMTAVPCMDGTSRPIDAVAVDTGHKPNVVYEFVRRNMGRLRIIPIKGDGQITSGEIFKWGEPLQNHPWIRLLHLHGTHWHDRAFDAMRVLEPKEGQSVVDAWKERNPRLHFYHGLEARIVDELTAEGIVEDINEKTGEVRRIYKKLRRCNDQFDLFRYMLLLREMMREDFAAASAEPAAPVQKPTPEQIAKQKQEEKEALAQVAQYPEYDEDDEDEWESG